MGWSFLSTLDSSPSSVFSTERWPFSSYVHILLLWYMFKESLNKRLAPRSRGSLSSTQVPKPALCPFLPYHLLQHSPMCNPSASFLRPTSEMSSRSIHLSLNLHCLSNLGYLSFSNKIHLPDSDWPPCPNFVNSDPSLFLSSVATRPETFPNANLIMLFHC